MITAVDSNVLLDVFTNNPGHADKSSLALRTQLQVGSLVACGVVWAEVATFFEKPEDLSGIMSRIGVDFLSDSEEVALVAAGVWKKYKRSGGKRDRLIADFLIGAHAVVHCDCLLSRDRGFYRTYFKGLKLIEPQ